MMGGLAGSIGPETGRIASVDTSERLIRTVVTSGLARSRLAIRVEQNSMSSLPESDDRAVQRAASSRVELDDAGN